MPGCNKTNLIIFQVVFIVQESFAVLLDLEYVLKINPWANTAIKLEICYTLKEKLNLNKKLWGHKIHWIPNIGGSPKMLLWYIL